MSLSVVLNKKWLIWVILLAALSLRLYHIRDLTGFYFDQGRDAKIIWEFWHSHKPFLIGPTTGIEGIFLGPFYYYLIAPFYLLGQGDPVYPAVALVVINTLGIYLIYLLGCRFFSHGTGLLAAFFIAFSAPLVEAHRWLSNPTPLPFFSALAVFFLLRLLNGSKNDLIWFGLGLVLGLCLQLEAASAVFFLPAVILLLFLYRRHVTWNIDLLHLLFAFSLTLIPQLWFNFRHENLLLDSFRRFLLADGSFAPVITGFYQTRLQFYFGSFIGKFFSDYWWSLVFGLVLFFLIVSVGKKLLSQSAVVLLVWFATPLIFLLFYHGNHGFVWDYYFTGVFPLFILFIAWILTRAFRLNWFTRSLVGIFVLVFFITNIFDLQKNYSAGLDTGKAVNLGTSRAAVDWVLSDAGHREFNVDVYVPPVVPHAYDYLFLWRGKTEFSSLPSANKVALLYLIYEADPSHPERLSAWLTRQAGYASPAGRIKFGGVTVERRERISI